MNHLVNIIQKLILVTLLVAGCFFIDEFPVMLGRGDILPFFTSKTLTGKTISEGYLASTPSVVILAIPDCQQSTNLIKNMNEEFWEYEEIRNGIKVLVIETGSEEDVKRIFKENGIILHCTVQPDGELAGKFAYGQMPKLFLSEAGGRILARYDRDNAVLKSRNALHQELLNILDQ